jgi:predicted DNA-binding transcriptional regulator YafY
MSQATVDARLYPFHPIQVMTDEPDVSLTVSFRAGGLRKICWYLFRWGNQVKIIAPRELQLLYQELMITTA